MRNFPSLRNSASIKEYSVLRMLVNVTCHVAMRVHGSKYSTELVKTGFNISEIYLICKKNLRHCHSFHFLNWWPFHSLLTANKNFIILSNCKSSSDLEWRICAQMARASPRRQSDSYAKPVSSHGANLIRQDKFEFDCEDLDLTNALYRLG